MTLLQILDRFPPCMVRLLARKHHGRAGMTHLDISRKAGLSISTVSDLSGRTTWANVTIWTADAFMHGCGVEMTKTKRHAELLRRRALRYTDTGNAAQRAMYGRLFGLRAK